MRLLFDPVAVTDGGIVTDDADEKPSQQADVSKGDSVVNLDNLSDDYDSNAEPMPLKASEPKEAPATKIEPKTDKPEPKPEDKEEDPLIPKDLFSKAKPKTETPNQQQNQKPNDKRDYSAFSPEDAARLKTAHNDVFAFAQEQLPKLYKAQQELAQLKQQAESYKKQVDSYGLPPTYFEHPEGYKLAPAYSQLESTYNRANDEIAYCRESLLAIEEGKEFRPFVDYDQRGQAILDKPRAGTAQDKLWLMEALGRAQQNAVSASQQASQLKQSFATRFKEAESSLGQFATKVSEMLPDDLKPSETEVKSFLEAKIAPERRHLPEAKAVAALWTIIVKQAKKLGDLQGKSQSQAIQQATQKKAAAPVKSSVGGFGGAPSKGGIVNLDDLASAMQDS